jgi:methylase of polypeptide subunit release factors
MDTNPPTNQMMRPDTARIASVPLSQALRFREVFIQSGYLAPSPDKTPELIEMRSRGGRNLPRLLRLASEETLLNLLARLFLLGVPVPTANARTMMRTVPIEEWQDAGLVSLDGEYLEGLVAISPFAGLLLATEKPELLDRGVEADYVCSLTESTATIARFIIQRPFGRVLDLCTGCGALGFLAASQSKYVLATDLNPKAIQLATFNARLNGINNIEFAVGSIFEPAAGGKFDLITANPPCVLGPAARYSFRDSGMELDGLCRQMIAEAPDHLTEGGIFQCTLEWPNIAGADWRERNLKSLQNLPCDALVLHLRTKDAPSHGEETVFDTDVLNSEEQSRLFTAYMDYFQSRGVTSISEGLIARRRRSGGLNWVEMENIPSRNPTPFGDAVYRYFETSDAIDRLGDGLFDLKLRMAPSIFVETARMWNGKAWQEGNYRIRQGSGFEFNATLDASIANLVRGCDGTARLRDLVATLAQDAKVPVDAVREGCLNLARSMLQKGFLVLPD